MVVSDMPGSFRNVESLEDYSDSNSITLTWVNPDRGDYQATKIIRRTDRMPQSPDDGDTQYWFNGTTFTDTNIITGKTYYYTLFAHDNNFNFSPGTGIAVKQ
jgi:hypothetical protein